MTVSPSSVRLDPARDLRLDDFSLQTLRDRYLTDDETSPQEAYARASAAFCGGDEALAQRLYDYSSKGWLSYATPLLSNGGTSRGLPISCFLAAAEDSREGIFSHWTEIGWLSSVGGGVGGYWGDLRSDGVKTSKGSKSTGMIPFIPPVDRIILAVSQGGTRRGSYAAYVDISHPEIEEFITIRKSTGGDANRKTLNLHNAINVTDEFMECLLAARPFNLVDPHTKTVVKTVDPRVLWKLIIETRMQMGEPYLHFVDTTNRGLPATQKAKGLRVRQSNLCFAPNTEVLTEDGYLPLGALEGQQAKVWNGETFSQVTIKRTSDLSELVRVWFEDGSYLDCTPDHKFYNPEGEAIHAIHLNAGQVMEPAFHPRIHNDKATEVEPDLAYVAGYATGRGIEDGGRLAIHVDASAPEEVRRRLFAHSIDAVADEDGKGWMLRFEPASIPSGHVPLTWRSEDATYWLAGLMDALGEWIEIEEDGARFLSFAHDNEDFVSTLRLLALQLGLCPRVRLTDTGNGFMLSENSVWSMTDEAIAGVGLEAQYDADSADNLWPVVADVHPLPYKVATYCFDEPLRHKAVFNGVLAGQCTEITLATGRDDQGKMRTAVCCLSSVNAETFNEWKDEPQFLEDVMTMLDNTLQVFIDSGQKGLENAIYSATQERSVGLGLLGFHAALQQRGIPFESDAARQFNIDIFRHIRRQADEASLKLGAERGEAPDMVGTGHRFAHRLAVAPNASTSILLGTSPSIEPTPANIFLHKTLSGSFPVRNRYLVKRLQELGKDTPEVWTSIKQAEGSIQHLDFLTDHDKRLFRTAMEIDQWWVVRHAADRQPFIDQAQSVNLFFGPGTTAPTLSRIHILAWEWGLKSLYYCRSKAKKRGENVNTKVERIQTTDAPAAPVETLDDVLAALNPVADSACIACEG